MMKLCSRMTVALLTLAAVSACTYQGGDIGDPVTRKFHWFSFVGGDDIRAGCATGTPDRIRLIYNGTYDRQLRIYEVDSLRKLLNAKVVGGGNLAEFDPQDLAAPWRAKESASQLDEAGYARLAAALSDSGVYAPAPVGLELPSQSYYWTAASCRQGRFSFTAFKYPSPAFDALAFPAVLMSLDQTGIAFNPAQPAAFDPQLEDRARRGEVTRFTLKVGTDGLVK